MGHRAQGRDKPLGWAAWGAPEADCIARARAGDRSAQDELLRAHYPRLFASAFRLLGNPEDAEDLAQECFVRAFRSLAFFRGEGSFAAWLRRILVHLAQDRFRVQALRTESLPLGSEPAGKAREPQERLEGRELQRALAEALRALAPPLRLALVLRTLDGLEYGEIAASTGVAPATARTRVMKARKELLRLLGPRLEGGIGERALTRPARKTGRRLP